VKKVYKKDLWHHDRLITNAVRNGHPQSGCTAQGNQIERISCQSPVISASVSRPMGIYFSVQPLLFAQAYVAPKPVQPLEYNLVSNNFSEFQKCHGRGTRAIVRLVLRLSAVVSIHPIMPANRRNKHRRHRRTETPKHVLASPPPTQFHTADRAPLRQH